MRDVDGALIRLIASRALFRIRDRSSVSRNLFFWEEERNERDGNRARRGRALHRAGGSGAEQRSIDVRREARRLRADEYHLGQRRGPGRYRECPSQDRAYPPQRTERNPGQQRTAPAEDVALRFA